VKSFWQLLNDPMFSLGLAVSLVLVGWNLAYGSWVLGAIFTVLIFGAIAANVWKTRKA
jgi:protein-S-isoprenylcysteine O-methyltransferase Ste14